jgi:hypothetical protein
MWTVLTEYGEDTDVLRARDRRIDGRTSRVKLARLWMRLLKAERLPQRARRQRVF